MHIQILDDCSEINSYRCAGNGRTTELSANGNFAERTISLPFVMTESSDPYEREQGDWTMSCRFTSSTWLAGSTVVCGTPFPPLLKTFLEAIPVHSMNDPNERHTFGGNRMRMLPYLNNKSYIPSCLSTSLFLVSSSKNSYVPD